MKLVTDHLVYFATLLALAGCNKASEPPPAPKPDYEAIAAAMDAADEERAARAHLTAAMTDEQILVAIGVDPASVQLKPAPEGYGGPSFKKTAYTNLAFDIEIERTLDTGGLFVVRLDQGTRWIVKGKRP
jgi:hypothetical protein